MASINKFIGIGRLGKDVESKHLPSGSMVANFSIACSEKYKDKTSGQYVEKIEWINIVCFGKTAELCGKYLSKGSQVYIEGKLQTRSWDDKDGNKRYTTEVLANTVQFLDSKSSGGGLVDSASNAKETLDSTMNAAFATEDIPF